jgi:hypothetical protein
VKSYIEVTIQNEMDSLLNSIAGFHDSMTKELHIINRGFVAENYSMIMAHQFDAQVLVQSQWKPYAIELVFTNVLHLNISDASEYGSASGSVEKIASPVERVKITMSFDKSFVISAEQLFYRVRSEWLGKQSFFGSEVPSVEAILAAQTEDNWRQCSVCRNIWEASLTEQFVLCPSCNLLTELEIPESA